MIINAFKNKIFPLYHEEDMFEGIINYNKLEKLIFSKRRNINDQLVNKHFLVPDLEALLKKMKEIKDAQKNKIHVSLARSGLRDLKEEI